MINKILLTLLLTLNLLGTLAMATEEPPYAETLKEGDFEVREYPSMIAAEVLVTGERSDAVSAGFRLLAGYIFGGNIKKQSIAMTAPVTQSGSENGWTVRFIMPQGYTLDSLPTPKDSQVKLVPLAPTRFAVVKFSGLAKEPDIIEQTQRLNEYVAKQKLTPTGPATLARYDPPWTLWFLRRNEMMIPMEN